MNIITLPIDILHTIKSFLSYQDRSRFLIVCKLFCRLKIDRFSPCSLFHTVVSLNRKHYCYSFHQICVNTFDPLFIPSPFFFPKGLQIIIFDTPQTYYDIRIFKNFDYPFKRIEDYLSDYGKDKKDYFIKRRISPILYVTSKL